MPARSDVGLCGLTLLGLTRPVVAQAPSTGADLKATIERDRKSVV